MKNLIQNIILLTFCSICYTNVSAQLTSIQWQTSLGGSLYEYTKEVENTTDGGYITVGYTTSSDGDVSLNNGNGDCWIVKLNALGIKEWEKNYGGSELDYGYSIKQTSDGGFIVAGYTESTNGDITSSFGTGDCWIIKLSSNGSIEWQKNYGGSSNDSGQSIFQTQDGGYIVGGYSESIDGDLSGSNGGVDAWVFKLNELGVIEWQKNYGGSLYDYLQDIKQTMDGGYVFCGGTNSNDGDVVEQNGDGDSWVVKLNSLGGIEWQNSLGGSSYDVGQFVEQTIDGGYISTGYTSSNDLDVINQHGAGDCWVVKCNNSGIVEWKEAYGSTGNDYAYCIRQMLDGGYILTGYSELNDGDVTGNHGSYDCWLVLIESNGEIRMQQSFGGAGVDIGYSVFEIAPGTFALAGYTESTDGDVAFSHGGGDCWILKLNLSSVQIEDVSLSELASVSPNPSAGNFHFSGLKKDATIIVYDVNGKVVCQVNSENFTCDIQLSYMAKGVYVYKILSESVVDQTGRIVLY